MTELLEQTFRKITEDHPKAKQEALAVFLSKHIDEIMEQAEEEMHLPPSVSSEEEFEEDPWDALDFDTIAVKTGISDLAENHDHYLYGLPKRETSNLR